MKWDLYKFYFLSPYLPMWFYCIG